MYSHCHLVIYISKVNKTCRWKNPKKVIFYKPKMIENALDTSHIHCHTARDISLD
jgi:hypothetical protein